MFLIFNKTTGVVHYKATTPKQLVNENAACLANEVDGATNFVTLEVADDAIPEGYEATLVDSSIVIAERPSIVAKRTAAAALATSQNNAKIKLEALGLDPDDIKVLIPGLS
jgi:hypothetical protein